MRSTGLEIKVAAGAGRENGWDTLSLSASACWAELSSPGDSGGELPPTGLFLSGLIVPSPLLFAFVWVSLSLKS